MSGTAKVLLIGGAVVAGVYVVSKLMTPSTKIIYPTAASQIAGGIGGIAAAAKSIASIFSPSNAASPTGYGTSNTITAEGTTLTQDPSYSGIYTQPGDVVGAD